MASEPSSCGEVGKRMSRATTSVMARGMGGAFYVMGPGLRTLDMIEPPMTAPATTPVPSPDETVIEFTLRAAVAGLLFGLLFGAANAYLGLRVGLTVSTSIPIAVLTVALFRVLPRRARENVILEANLSQTMGSASSSLASGTIFTIPALFLWGLTPPLGQVALLALLGGVLGISAMVP